MKTYDISRLGAAAIAAVLVLGIGSCAHHGKKPASPPAPVAPVSQPKAQVTVLEAPKSLEGAWIKVKAHGKGESVGSKTYWWYIKNGISHHYWEGDIPEGHPATPADVGKPQITLGLMFPRCEDSLGRGYNVGTISYQHRGKTATLKIEDFARHDPTLCRSASVEDGSIYVSKEPAVITLKSAGSGVYHGTIKGIFSPDGMPPDGLQELDSITIYTE